MKEKPDPDPNMEILKSALINELRHMPNQATRFDDMRAEINQEIQVSSQKESDLDEDPDIWILQMQKVANLKEKVEVLNEIEKSYKNSP